MKSISVKRLKPRNPVAAVCWKRRAARHEQGAGALRMAGRRSLRREVAEFMFHPPST